MAATPSDLKKFFTEFSDEGTSRLQFFIDMAGRRISSKFFGDKADDAQCLLAAHLLTMANRQGVGGAVTQEKVGDLSQSFSSPKGSDDNSYSATSYGQMYLDLMKSCRSVPRVLGCQNP